jgi:hypothetical protein
MRMQDYRSNVMLNTSYWLAPKIEEIRRLESLGPHFHMDVIKAFFPIFNDLLNRSRQDFLYDRLAVKECIIATMVADLEGGYVSPEGLPMPREFEPKEIDIIVHLVCFLYDDLLMAIDHRCLDSTAELEFLRLAGHDILFRFRSHHHPFQSPGPKQLGIMRRVDPEDIDNDLVPIRHWI